MVQSNYDRIFHFINNNPGCHFRKIKKEVDLSIGTVQYHVINLEKDGKVISISRNIYRCYYPVGIFQEHEKEILQILNHKNTREILLYIIGEKNPTRNDMINDLKLSNSALIWNLQRLISYNLILETNDKKFKRYSIHDKYVNVPIVIKLLKHYYSNIWNKWSNRLAETFMLLSGENRKNK